MKNKKTTELVLEIGAEGGGLNIYRSCLPGQNGAATCRYFWTLSDMGLEDDEPGILLDKKQAFYTFEEALQDVLNRYPEIFMLYAEFIHTDYRKTLLERIKKWIFVEKRMDVNEMYSMESWLEQLHVSREALTGESTDNIY